MQRPLFTLPLTILIALIILTMVEKTARAGGLEYPDNGAEAMGRGAAFTAKADDGTALIYNVAGFARQRGWRLTFGSNTAFHSAEFQRSGVYPDDPKDPLTPWGGEKFPLVKSRGTPIPIPHLVLSTDLGTDRLTVGMGVYAPSVLGGRVFPLGVDGKPSPARYDAIKGGGLIVYPSLFAAYRVTEWLDVGVGGNFVVSSLEATSMASADLAKAICPNQEYQPCDTRQTIATTGTAMAFSFGTMVRPSRSFAIGLQFRTPFKLETEGTVTAKSPNVQPAPIAPGQAFLTQPFPWVLRGGIRYISMDGRREAWDAEVDFTYEAWGSALKDGTQVYVPKLSLFENIRSTIRMGFQDTMSLRAGGSYNIPVGANDTISLRAGAYHDTSATRPENTRMLFDTLAKTGVTAGIGFKHGPAMVNLAFARVFHASREVSNGEVRPINGSANGQSINSEGVPYAPVNNGTFTASTWVVAFGVTIQIEELFGKKRIPAYGADYEVTTTNTPRSPDGPKSNDEDDEAKKKKNANDPAVATSTTAPDKPEKPVVTASAWASMIDTGADMTSTSSPSTSTTTAAAVVEEKVEATEPPPPPPPTKKATKRSKKPRAPKAAMPVRTSAAR